MDILELIRNADSAAEILQALSAYVQTLPVPSVFPDGLRLPLQSEADVFQRTLALITVVNLSSLNHRDEDCRLAKRALRIFAAAAWKLRRR